MLASEIAQSFQLDDVLEADGSACLAAFARAAMSDAQLRVESFLRDRPRDDRSQLPGLIAIEMRQRYARGDFCPIESYLERFPELRGHKENVLDLIYAEY